MNQPIARLARPARPAAYAGVAALLSVGLAGCGPSSAAGTPGGTSTDAAPSNPQGGSSPDAGRGGRQRPGASGLIAAIEGRTLQVQSRTAQTAVTYTATTRITTQVKASAAALTVGACVTVRADTSPDGEAGGATAQPSTRPTTIAASTVQVVAPTNGSCSPTGEFGRGKGGGPAGARPTDLPSGLPSGVSTGAPSGRRGGFAGFGAFGTVASVGAGTFTVTAPGFGAPGSTSATSRTVTVTYGSATTFTSTAAGTAKDIRVGECARAVGKADDTGAVTATSLSLSPAENGQCAGGFGGFGGSGGTGVRNA